MSDNQHHDTILKVLSHLTLGVSQTEVDHKQAPVSRIDRAITKIVIHQWHGEDPITINLKRLLSHLKHEATLHSPSLSCTLIQTALAFSPPERFEHVMRALSNLGLS